METKEITMPTKYDPQTIEKGRYKWWLQGKSDRSHVVL